MNIDTRGLSRFARRVLRTLGLRDWTIRIGPIPAEYGPFVYRDAGLCDYRQHRIAVLCPILHPADWSVQETIVHEIAHALGDNSHGPIFLRDYDSLCHRFLGPLGIQPRMPCALDVAMAWGIAREGQP